MDSERLGLFALVSLCSIKSKICNGDQVKSGKVAISLKAFGLADALASIYPNANLDEEIVLRYEELAGCFSQALRDYNARKL
jgi:hypothetical protein